MAKGKTVYICQNCGTESPKWMGKCPGCGEWNSFTEEWIEQKKPSHTPTATSNQPQKLSEIVSEQENRLGIADNEFNRVLGGGLVPGSVVLIGGEPGIGKSTLMLQMALALPALKTLYISGEESLQQIKLRADRLKTAMDGKNDGTDQCYIITETHMEPMLKQTEQVKPDLIIVDSIQTLQSSNMESAAGSISQIRNCTAELIQYAKTSQVPVILIGHINKEGQLAGPKVLEHMVDTVIQFEGDRHLTYRMLRTIKNRFGSTAELGIYEMGQQGLRQVTNPSEILISQKDEDYSGVAIGSTLEGNRPLLIEVQSLISPATYGTPQRSSTGFDTKRLNMLLAVLEKRGGLRLGTQDVFLNIAGGLKVEDPAIDLAVCASIISSFYDIPIPSKICFAGEVGLSGEIRAINRIENRIAEAEKLGFSALYLSGFHLKTLQASGFKINLESVSKIQEIIETLVMNAE